MNLKMTHMILKISHMIFLPGGARGGENFGKKIKYTPVIFKIIYCNKKYRRATIFTTRKEKVLVKKS